MRNWIYALANVLPWPVNKGAKWLADRIFGVFNDGVAFARWVKDGFFTLARDGKAFLNSAHSWFAEMYVTVRHIVTVRIPRMANDAVQRATKWAADRVTWALNQAKALISTLDRWAKTAISMLRSWAEGAVRWLTGQVNSLIANARKLLDRVFGLWATPLRLAEWLIGALWSVALRYLYQQRDRIATWLFRESGAFTVWLARQLESILLRLL